MTEQEKGMMATATIVRQLVPPQLEVLMIIYPPGQPDKISSMIVAVESMRDGTKHGATLERAKKAAKAFTDAPPNFPGFNPQS